MIALLLANATNGKTGKCFPSIPMLMKWARMSDRGVEGAINQLMRDGILTRKTGGGRGHSNQYSFCSGVSETPNSLPLLESEKGNSLRGLNGETPNSLPETPNSLPPPNIKEPELTGIYGADAPASNDANKSFSKTEKKTRFQSPTLEQVTAYFAELALPPSEAERFHNHHQAAGWLLSNRRPMVDWKAAARTWRGNYNKYAPNGTNSHRPQDHPDNPRKAAQRDYKLAADL